MRRLARHAMSCLPMLFAGLVFCPGWSEQREAVDNRPKIGLIIDDLGFQRALDRQVLALDSRVAVAVIPSAPGAQRISLEAAQGQRDVLIHLPLSHAGPSDCDAPLCPQRDWSAEQMRQHLVWASEQVKGAIGLNNHQGSAFTADRQASRQLVDGMVLFNRVQERPLFVLDSRTTPHTRLAQSAREAGLAVAERQVFLDHDRDPKAIANAWQQLLVMAETSGQAIAIGHPYPETLAFLTEALAKLESSGVQLVRLSELIEQPEPTRCVALPETGVSYR